MHQQKHRNLLSSDFCLACEEIDEYQWGRGVRDRQGNALSRVVSLLVRSLRLALAKHRQRRQLMALDDHRLHDLGLTREQVHEEAAKWFWQ